MLLRAITIALLVGAAVASPIAHAKRLSRPSYHAASHGSAAVCPGTKTGQCISSAPIAMLSMNTSSAAECAALCYKYRYVTTTVTAACGNWTFTTNNTVKPYPNCLIHPIAPTPAIINSTACTSGPPCAGPCSNMTDCNGGS